MTQIEPNVRINECHLIQNTSTYYMNMCKFERVIVWNAVGVGMQKNTITIWNCINNSQFMLKQENNKREIFRINNGSLKYRNWFSLPNQISIVPLFKEMPYFNFLFEWLEVIRIKLGQIWKKKKNKNNNKTKINSSKSILRSFTLKLVCSMVFNRLQFLISMSIGISMSWNAHQNFSKTKCQQKKSYADFVCGMWMWIFVAPAQWFTMCSLVCMLSIW